MSGRRLLTLLGSPKLAAVLIAVLVALNVIAVLVPQQGVLGDTAERFAAEYPALAGAFATIGLDRVFRGWPVVLVSALLAINVTACTVNRILRRRRPPQPGAPSSARSEELSSDWSPERYLQAVTKELGAARYTVLARTDKGVAARAGGSGFLGSVVLHVSLLVLIAGGATTAVTSFRGEIDLTTGETVVDTRRAYTVVKNMPEYGNAFSGAQIKLESTDIRYEDGRIVSAVARMTATDGAGKIVTKDVRVNHPLDAFGKSYLFMNSGYAAAITVVLPGEQPDAAVVRLSKETPYGWEDSVELPPSGGQPVKLELRATPVPLPDGAKLPAEKLAIIEPRLFATLYHGEKVVWQGVLAKGDTAEPVPGMSLTFNDLVLWNNFLVRGEPARWITYIGFWMMVVGAAWRFLVPERRLGLVLDGRTVRAAVVSRPWAGLSADKDRELVDRLLGLAVSGPERGR